MKILHYCQHVLGIGHFFRSMEIARALAPNEVLFVEGGEPLEGYAVPAHVQRRFLPPLMMDTEFRTLEAGGADPEAVMARRKAILLSTFLDFAPDVLLIELFPFGRKRFSFELLPVLETIRDRNLPTKVACSLRDILVEKQDPEKYEKRVLKWLNAHFDLLLIHADPALIRLDETFERVNDIRPPVIYTGFVARPPVERRSAGGPKTLLASSGGGRVGADLLLAAVEAFRRLPSLDACLRVFMGPFMEDPDRRSLADAAARDARVTLETFALDFPAELAAADLSISMAGYNTCMDVLAAGLRSLLHPFGQNREQGMRARRLEHMGLTHVLETLSPDYIAEKIQLSLAAPPPDTRGRLDMNGAEKSARALDALV